jgi:hypothetical protein
MPAEHEPKNRFFRNWARRRAKRDQERVETLSYPDAEQETLSVEALREAEKARKAEFRTKNYGRWDNRW